MSTKSEPSKSEPSKSNMSFKRIFKFELSPDTREHPKAKWEKKQEIYKAQDKQEMLAKRRKFMEQGSFNLAFEITNPRRLCCKSRHPKELDHQCVIAQLTRQHEQMMEELEALNAKIEQGCVCKCGENGDKVSSTGL
ncbi:hypothetical protein LTS10_003839 [Elasticomyces elasticus]|nr:hypothetical protein LTS10_003839 [Elasticomyces elasticus]